MGLVLGATGLFLYLRLATELDNAINDGLRSRAGDVAALEREADSGLSERSLTSRAESFAEILNPRGQVLDSTPQVGRHVLLTPSELARAAAGTIYLDRGPLAGLSDESRLMASPSRIRGRRVVIVVGLSTETRSDALDRLLTLLLIGGPVALLLASAAGYGVAAAALRPVEAMRSRATEISTIEPSARLPVPHTRDEVERLGATLNQMLERIGAAMTREREFVADASHELRTPLAILKAELELAMREGRSRGELEAAVASAAEETDRLSQLADDLLMIAQSDQGLLAVRRSRLHVADLLADVRRRFAGRAREAGRELRVDAPPELRVMADPQRLEQALGNMVDNALRYGDGPIQIDGQRVDGEVELHVLDSGPGFPPAFLGRAFKRFSRADGRDRAGTGLGLAIVDSIARSQDGRAGASNRSEGGADVWVALPGQRQD